MSVHDITTLLGIVAWPFTVLVIAFLLRTELIRLLRRVREFAGPGNVKVAFDPAKVGELIEDAKKENTSAGALAERLERSVTVFDNHQARILRALLDDDGRAMYNYQTEYYRDSLNSLIKQGYIERLAKEFALTSLGKVKTKQYLMPVLDRIPDQ